ncbi:MAG: aminotransferase class III-fold pyridoxal phosphate-dependent enzyme [Crocinitomicaceae bacterium]|nr:aminotransferase class III-fold pyridoxal phosphate-dependent enzyme [Crocinitomicaceae bacterium]
MSESSSTSKEVIQNNLDYTLFSWSKQAGLNPVHAVRAEGVYVYPADGKRIIDFSSQLMNVNIGHGNQRITKAVSDQMEKFSFVYPGMATEIRGKLGKKLAELTPGNLTKAFFTVSGAEGIENSIKLARIYTGRHKIISHYRAYHGATYGALSAGGDPRKFAMDVQGLPNFVRVENPYAYRCPWGTDSLEECGEMALAHIERVIKFENPESVAAILFEGESGSSGCIKYPPNYWKKLRIMADKYGILLIDDEVMSGFGRTGKMFGIDHHETTPDIMVLAKGLTSAYIPFGAMMVSDKIANHFNDIPMVLGLTCAAHPVACAAALENIKIIEDGNLVQNAAEMGKYMEQEVAKLMEKHPSIGDFRNTGLLGCIELVKDRKTKEPVSPWNASGDDMEPTLRMAAKMKEQGLFTFVRWNWIFIAPPLIITKQEIDEGLKIISKVIEIADEYYTGE